jgi:hypothetical protein
MYSPLLRRDRDKEEVKVGDQMKEAGYGNQARSNEPRRKEI